MKKQEVNQNAKSVENESGRSMVEMLGVLAIMGVLAIGGIAGYRWAMDKYNANEILNEVRKRAVTASQQRILGHAINLSEYGDNTIQGHTVTTADHYNGDTSFFALTVSEIEKGVCDKVLAEKIPFAVDTWVGEDADECAEGDNAITFVFANDLNDQACIAENKPLGPKECPLGWVGDLCNIPDNACGGHGAWTNAYVSISYCICENGWGGNNCEVNCPNKQYPLEGLDADGNPNGSCQSCLTSSINISADNCAKCPNRFVGTIGGHSVCVPCTYDDQNWAANVIRAEESECAKCPNRKMVSGKCRLKCDGIVDNYSNKCYPCESNESVHVANKEECAKCPNREMWDGYCILKQDCDGFRGTYGDCFPCDYNEEIPWSHNRLECEKCVNREQYGNYCVLKECNGFLGPDFKCYPCDIKDPVYMGSSSVKSVCARKCPNRKEHGDYCVLKDCDGFWGYDGVCYSCDTEAPIYTFFTSSCDRCSNREMIKKDCVLTGCKDGFLDYNGQCHLCTKQQAVNVNSDDTECAKCSNRQMKGKYCILKECNGFQDDSGTCYSCDVADSIYTSSMECSKCSNRERKSGYCILKDCAGFRNSSGKCYSCTDESSVWFSNKETGQAECDKCSERGMYGNYCILDNECDGFRNGSGTCYSCDIREAIYVSSSECDKCNNREQVGKYCVLKQSCDGFWNPDNGRCYSCWEPQEQKVGLTSEGIQECAKCPNREMWGPYCRLKRE